MDYHLLAGKVLSEAYRGHMFAFKDKTYSPQQAGRDLFHILAAQANATAAVFGGIQGLKIQGEEVFLGNISPAFFLPFLLDAAELARQKSQVEDKIINLEHISPPILEGMPEYRATLKTDLQPPAVEIASPD